MTIKTTPQTKKNLREMAKEENKPESRIVEDAVGSYGFAKKWKEIRSTNKKIIKDFANAS